MAIEQDIVTWLEQHSINLHLQDVPGRKAFLFAAGLGELQNTLVLEGATLVFCRNFVQQLRQHGTLSDGRDPLIAVLETAKTMVGQDKQVECDKLIVNAQQAERHPSSGQSPQANGADKSSNATRITQTAGDYAILIGQARNVTIKK